MRTSTKSKKHLVGGAYGHPAPSQHLGLAFIIRESGFHITANRRNSRAGQCRSASVFISLVHCARWTEKHVTLCLELCLPSRPTWLRLQCMQALQQHSLHQHETCTARTLNHSPTCKVHVSSATPATSSLRWCRHDPSQSSCQFLLLQRNKTHNFKGLFQTLERWRCEDLSTSFLSRGNQRECKRVPNKNQSYVAEPTWQKKRLQLWSIERAAAQIVHFVFAVESDTGDGTSIEGDLLCSHKEENEVSSILFANLLAVGGLCTPQQREGRVGSEESFRPSCVENDTLFGAAPVSKLQKNRRVQQDRVCSVTAQFGAWACKKRNSGACEKNIGAGRNISQTSGPQLHSAIHCNKRSGSLTKLCRS